MKRWVELSKSETLRQTLELAFLEHVGVTGDSASELLNITRKNLLILNRIRADGLEAIC